MLRLLPTALVLCGSVISASAQPSTDTLPAAYQRMIAQPGDADATAHYARLAAEAGQKRAAISALERLLRLHPELDNIRLQLASLYLSQNSPDLAAIYARQALEAPTIPEPVATQARTLAATADEASKRSRLSMTFSTGVRYDSDANQATALDVVTATSPLFGTVQVPTPIRSQSDWSSVLSAQVAHSYDLGLQREARWETNFSLFDQRFFHVNAAYDLDVIGLDTGPRVSLGSAGPAAFSIRPLATVTWLGYKEQTFATLFGGGLSLGVQLPHGLSFDLTGITRQGQYVNSSFRPTADLYTGLEQSAALTASYVFSPVTRISATATYYHADANANYNVRSGPGGAVAAATAVTVGNRLVQLAGRFSIQHLDYKAPDPFIDAGRSRVDTVLEVGLTASVPLIGPVSAFTQYGYSNFASRYQIYRFDNHALTLGLRVDL